MNNNRWIGSLACVLLLAFILVGCEQTGGGGGDIVVAVSFSAAGYDVVGNTLDFGFIPVGTDSLTVRVTITNESAKVVEITTLSIDDTESFTLTPPVLPRTLRIGERADGGSLVFSPQDSGEVTTTISATFGPPETTVTGNVSGTGDYAPTIRFKTSVSNATLHAEVNGDYYSNPLLHNTLITYLKPGTPDLYIYYFQNDGDFWGIDSVFSEGYPHGDLGAPLYGAWADVNSDYPPDTNMSQWGEKVSSPPIDVIDVKTQVYSIYSPDQLLANYDFLDEDGVLEGGWEFLDRQTPLTH